MEPCKLKFTQTSNNAYSICARCVGYINLHNFLFGDPQVPDYFRIPATYTSIYNTCWNHNCPRIPNKCIYPWVLAMNITLIIKHHTSPEEKMHQHHSDFFLGCCSTPSRKGRLWQTLVGRKFNAPPAPPHVELPLFVVTSRALVQFVEQYLQRAVAAGRATCWKVQQSFNKTVAPLVDCP